MRSLRASANDEEEAQPPESFHIVQSGKLEWIRHFWRQERVMRGVQYLVDDGGKRRAVVIDLKRQGQLWEDFYDRAVAESRRDEPRESLEAVKAKLGRRRGRRAGG